VDWKVEDEEVLKNMSATNVSDTATYYGEITFKESVNGVIVGVKKAEIVLSKSEKQFGDIKKEVWSVFICSIE